MDIQKLTKEQAVIISGFTGILCGEFSDFHADVEKRLGRGVQTFEMGMKSFMADIKKLYEADFIEMGTVSKEEAKAQAVQEWISVKNAMPKAGSWFVAYDDFNGFVDTGKADGHEEPNNVFFSHWMPLPNTPKAQEPTND